MDITFEDAIGMFLPSHMRGEDLATLQTRECTICPPSMSIRCAHFNGFYVVEHDVLNNGVGPQRYICAGHNQIMRDSWLRNGVHNTECLWPCRLYSPAANEARWELLTEALLAGTLYAQYLGFGLSNMSDDALHKPATLVLSTEINAPPSPAV